MCVSKKELKILRFLYKKPKTVSQINKSFFKDMNSCIEMIENLSDHKYLIFQIEYVSEQNFVYPTITENNLCKITNEGEIVVEKDTREKLKFVLSTLLLPIFVAVIAGIILAA